jgi:ribosomal protein S18 acetylase RimI-like enzyme
MHELDNIIWRALSTSQAHLARSSGCARKFHDEVSLLGAISEPGEAGYRSLACLVAHGEQVGLFLEQPPQPPSEWTVARSVPLLQMEGCRLSSETGAAASVVDLGESDVAEMMGLAELTKPGPFRARTREMGDYFGIRQNGKLVAMAGERLRVPGHTEISAVCTHPDYLGRGYAATLVTLLMRRIFERGEKPFLHVRPDNQRAVSLYERLGFTKRALLRYAVLTPAG